MNDLTERVRNYLGWMPAYDKDYSHWQWQIADYMDMGHLHISEGGNGAVNFMNNDRVALPGGRINWANVNNIQPLLIAWKC